MTLENGVTLECGWEAPVPQKVQAFGIQQLYFTITVRTQGGKFTPSRGTPRVYVTETHTLDGSDTTGAISCP